MFWETAQIFETNFAVLALLLLYCEPAYSIFGAVNMHFNANNDCDLQFGPIWFGRTATDLSQLGEKTAVLATLLPSVSGHV